MISKRKKELATIEQNFLMGISDTQQAKKLGLSKQGFYQRCWSLRKEDLLEKWEKAQ